MKCVLPICIMFMLGISAGCKKDDKPDLSQYTSKLAGDRVWNGYIYFSISNATMHYDNEPFSIVVNDEQTVTLSGHVIGEVRLTYQSSDDSSVIYASDLYSERLDYNYRTDSIKYTYSYGIHGGYAESAWAAHL